VDVATIIRRPHVERKACAISFQQQYISGCGFLVHIVTVVDVLLPYTGAKHVSKEWKHCGSVTFKVMSLLTVIAIMFLDRRCVLLVGFMQQGTTICGCMLFKAGTLNSCQQSCLFLLMKCA
jgi:hypothetical protein